MDSQQVLIQTAEGLFKSLTFETATLILALLVVLLVFFSLYNLLGSNLKGLGRKLIKSAKARRVVKLLFAPRWWGVALLLVATVLYSVIYAFHYFFNRPYVIHQSPAASEAWVDFSKPITIEFDKPVKTSSLNFNISLNTPGDVVWEPIFPSWVPEGMQTYRKLSYFPKQTVLPDENFVVYLVGIESLTGNGGVHEHNLDFTAPQTPGIKLTSIADGAKDVEADKNLLIGFDRDNGDFVDWTYQVTPETKFTINQITPRLAQLKFDDVLEQDTEYKIMATRTIVEKELATGQVLSQFEPEVAWQGSFRTVKTPLIQSISPKGTGVLTDVSITAIFEMEMDQGSFDGALKIEPAIAGDFSWKDNKTLIFKPTEKWNKDTEYTFTVAKGVRSIVGGQTFRDITHKFRTVGKVKATALLPANGSASVSADTGITVQFDQPVDKASAQAAFKISPNAKGSFSWNGNKMTFRPSGNLGYSTTYSVTIGKGIKAIYGDTSVESYSTRFTTRTETFTLGVPLYTQQERFTCNVASTRMALAYRGIYLSEGSIKSGMGVGPSLSGGSGGDPYSYWIDGYGTYWTNVAAFVDNYRGVSTKRNWNLTGMLNEVRNGNPVIIWWHNGWSNWHWKSWTTPSGATVSGLNGMHSEVVIGYKGTPSNPTTIITRDPWRGTRYYTRSYFDSLWARSFSRTGVVVR